MCYWKRVFAFVTAIGLLATSSAQGPGMGGGMMADSAGMQRGMGCGMMMMGFVMPKEVIKADDGGLYVVVGNRIIKYDKKLNVQSEAVIQLDTAAVNQLMRQMQDQCPMRRSQSGEQPQGNEQAPDQNPQPSEEE